MIRVLEELLRVVVYGGGGALFGYSFCLWINDQHRLASAILNESEKDMPTRRRFLSTTTLQSGVVVLVMIALLLTGIVWIKNGRENAAQDKRDCELLAEVSQTLRGRTANYTEQAVAERRLWEDIRKILARLSESGDESPAIRSIDVYLKAHDAYLKHLRDNPYPRDIPEDC